MIVHVAADIAHQRISDDQRRRGEVVGAAVGRHAAFEIAVARQHRRHDEVMLGDRRRQRRGERARIADAGGAAIADEVEADRVEVFGQAGAVEIVGDDLAARGEAGLDPRLAVEAERAGLARDEAGGDQHRRVGGVGAAGDRGDHHVAVADLDNPSPSTATRGSFMLLVGRFEFGVELLVDVGQAHAVLRALGAGEARLDRRHVELERVGEQGIGRARRRATCPAPWRRRGPARCGRRRGR